MNEQGPRILTPVTLNYGLDTLGMDGNFLDFNPMSSSNKEAGKVEVAKAAVKAALPKGESVTVLAEPPMTTLTGTPTLETTPEMPLPNDSSIQTTVSTSESPAASVTVEGEKQSTAALPPPPAPFLESQTTGKLELPV